MKMTLRTAVIATSTFVCTALFSLGWSEQGNLSLSVSKADAQGRLYIRSGYGSRAVYTHAAGLPWYAVGPTIRMARGAAPGTAMPAGPTMRHATALAARPVPSSQAATASCTTANRTV